MGLNSFQTSGNSPGARCRVGLLGFGTVGSALARRLTGPDSIPSLELTHIYDRRAFEKRARAPEELASSPITWTDRLDDLLTSDVDIVVEVIGGAGPATDSIRAALLAGKSVVTANKQVMARQGTALLTIAERQGRQLRFEAAVGGAMPIVRALGEGLAGDRVLRIDAILNGTTNAVLSQMDATGCVIEDAIADACARGYAEADPSADLDGSDAAAKLAILCALAFGVRVAPDRIDTRTCAGIGVDTFQDARRRTGTLRQIAHAAYDRDRQALSAWVAPTFVAAGSFFARTLGAQNAAVIATQYAGEITITGPGAGGDATAVAVIGDLVAIARDRAAIVPAPVLTEPQVVNGLADQKLAEAV